MLPSLWGVWKLFHLYEQGGWQAVGMAMMMHCWQTAPPCVALHQMSESPPWLSSLWSWVSD